MSKVLKNWIFLSTIHLCAAALSTILGIDRLSAIIAGTIYLPLWLFSTLGVPVFQQNQLMFPPPNPFGWALAVTFWALLYWAIATLLVRIFQKRSRAA
jgi:hypothetical protein